MREIVQGGSEKREVGAGNSFKTTLGLFVTLCTGSLFFLNFYTVSQSIYFLSLLYLAPFCSVVSPFPSSLSRVPPTASSSNLSLEAASNRISLTNTLH